MLKRLGRKVLPTYNLTLPYSPYGGTEPGTNVPPIVLNRFNCVLIVSIDFSIVLVAFLSVPSLSSDHVGPGTTQFTKVRRLGSRSARGLLADPGNSPQDRPGNQMFQKPDLALYI